MRQTVTSLLVALLLCISWVGASETDRLEVTKTVVSGTNGVFTVSVGYRVIGSVAPGRISGVTIVDSLPKNLDLVSGNLVIKGEEPTDEWTYNVYQVKAREIAFTLAQRSVDIELPAAEISWSQNAGNTVTHHTTHTKPVSLAVELVVPKGTFQLTPLVAFFTLVFPLIAALYAIPHFRQAEIKELKKKKKRS